MRRNTFFVFRFLLFLLFIRPVFAESPIQERADRFLALANSGYQALYRVNSEAQWLAVTDVTPAHDAAAEATGKAYAAFNGNPTIISEARDLLTHENELNELTIRQLKQLLLNAAEGPMTNPDLVAKRVAAETKQASILNGFEFKLNGQPITVNQIDDKLEKSVDLNERKAVWEASKQSGPALKPNLVTLRDLRNGVAKEMKYPDYFSLEVAAYGMTTDEMLKMLEDWMATLRPLYLQLHTWAKYKLAEKFHQPVPKKIPAHWINNRWGQEWPGLVEAADIDKYFKDRKRGMDYQNGRAILHWARFFPFTAKFLGKIGFVSAAARFETKEEYPRLVLAHRSAERHSFAAKHRTERALVFHRAPRTRSRILLQGLFAPGSSVLVTTRRGTGLS